MVSSTLQGLWALARGSATVLPCILHAAPLCLSFLGLSCTIYTVQLVLNIPSFSGGWGLLQPPSPLSSQPSDTSFSLLGTLCVLICWHFLGRFDSYVVFLYTSHFGQLLPQEGFQEPPPGPVQCFSSVTPEHCLSSTVVFINLDYQCRLPVYIPPASELQREPCARLYCYQGLSQACENSPPRYLL